jgi:hypothetical protein
MALHLGAAEDEKQVPLLLGFDALRRRHHVAGGGDVHHRLDDRRRSAGAGQVLDEGAIDLDLVERKRCR